jgi:hypothetical protein
MGVLRIPPGAVDHRGKVHASIGGEDAPPPDDWLVPIGPSIKIDLIGARLTSDATIELAIRPPSAAGSLTPVAMVFDDVQHRWLKDESSGYDSASRRIVVHTRHFSWWQAFTWNWDWTSRMAHSLVEGTFNNGGLVGAAPPNCPNRDRAENRLRSFAMSGNPFSGHAVPGGDQLLWCPDVDEDGQLVLRVVNNRRMAIQVKLLAGLELDPSTKPFLRSIGAMADEYLNSIDGIPSTVLGHGEQASFIVTSLSPRAYIGTTPSAATFATDVIDIGVRLLALTYIAGGSSASSAEAVTRQLLDVYGIGKCIAGQLDYKSVLANPTDTNAIAWSVGRLLSSCGLKAVSEYIGKHGAEKFVIGASAVFKAVNVFMDVLKAGYGAAEYLKDVADGRWNYYVVLEPRPLEASGSTTHSGSTTPNGPTTPNDSITPNGSMTTTGTEVQFKRLFTRDSNGVESATLQCGGTQVQLAADFSNNSNSTVDATARLGVFDPGLSLYQYLETFNVKLNPGLTTISKPWTPQHWVNGSMRYDLKVQWAGGEVSESYSFDLAFDPRCAQPPTESGGVSAESSEPTAAASETPTTEPRETQTSAPTETATAPAPEASQAVEPTRAPETTPSAPVPFYTLAPTS